MKKAGVFVILAILIFSIVPIILADVNNTNNTSSTTEVVSSQQDPAKIAKGFTCLESKVEGKCSSLSIQDISLTILASPKTSVFDECLDALQAKKRTDNCWGASGCNIKDTAMAILALEHAGEDTSKAEAWLLAQNKTPTDLIWFLQQDSSEAADCHVKYGSNDFLFSVDVYKKLSADAGSCLTRAQSDFWLKIAPSCYNNEFIIECNQKFIATLLYKNQNSETIHVLDSTVSQPAFGSITLRVKAQCFATTGSSCNYEATAWAALALKKTGHDVIDYTPYLIALAETNERYLPKSFIYQVTDYQDYADELVTEQQLGNYWEATNTAYDRFYDTSLALISLRSNSESNVIKARDWLLFSQAANGCWQNSVRDTSIALWALEGREGRGGGGGGTVTRCTSANFYCIPESDCPSAEKLGNYFCSSLSTVCCEKENLKTCSEYSGRVCSTTEFCNGNERRATDIDACCVGTCEVRTTTSECEQMGNICRTTCSENQDKVTYSCGSDATQSCCASKTTPTGSLLWLWIVLIILIILLVIAIIFRDRLKLWWFKFRNKFKKEGSSATPTSSVGPGYPPRPGFPPIRRMPLPVPPRQYQQQAQQRPGSRPGSEGPIDDVFRKLKEMSK